MKPTAPLATLPPLLLALVAGACAAGPSFDSAADLRSRYAAGLGSGAAGVAVPFELDADLADRIARELPTHGDERRRVDAVVDYIFNRLDLHYALTPTRTAPETFRARQGNCLSFVNLFVGIARQQRLAPFYVEVEDHQRWSYRDGLVVSQGHIVAGLYVDGDLRTFDFLPYRPKSYRQFRPIDDLTAAAHYYNNLGAEALLAGDQERAVELLEVAVGIAPQFLKALNNLGVVLARRGELARAEAVYRQALELAPEDVALLSNLARLHHQRGDAAAARGLLARVEEVRTTNPFFYVTVGELALARGDHRQALDAMARALRLDSEVPEVHVGLAKVYLAMGDLERARHHVGRALRLDATHPEARQVARLIGGAGTGAGAPAGGALQ